MLRVCVASLGAHVTIIISIYLSSYEGQIGEPGAKGMHGAPGGSNIVACNEYLSIYSYEGQKGEPGAKGMRGPPGGSNTVTSNEYLSIYLVMKVRRESPVRTVCMVLLGAQILLQ